MDGHRRADLPHQNSRHYSLGFFLGTVWNDGIDSSMTTQGNLSSRKIVFCGANGVGSSSDAIVKSIVSESLLSSKNKCVPQHAANERIRFAYANFPRLTFCQDQIFARH